MESGLSLASVSIVAPCRISDEDVRTAAADRLSDVLKCGFEIVAVDIVEEGEIETPLGVIKGVRYMVSFIRKEDVIFTHPDYEELLSESFKPWKI